MQASRNPTFQKSKNLKFQKSKNLKKSKIQNFLHLRNLAIVFGFLDLWIFGFFVFYTSICRNSSKIGFGKKTAFVSVFTVFVRGVRVV